MGADDAATTYVNAPADIVWHRTELGPEFFLSDNLVADDYSSVFSAQLTSSVQAADPHNTVAPNNHAFYFLTGTASVTIGDKTWPVTPGTFVKVTAHKQRSLTNTGTEDLVFLVIYDPPHTDGTP